MEIKAQDLRFGNLIKEIKTEIIYTNSGTLLRGCYVSKPMQFGDYFLRYEELEPIPLTEEWLLKFGLTERYCNGEWSWSKCTDGIIWDSYTEIYKRDDGFKYLAAYPLIKYVHQLQNIYHSLTGQELTIK